jgi:hypothetical protein
MILSSINDGMGDILLLTAIAKHQPTAEIHLQPTAARFSRFFRDISSKIVITQNIIPVPEIGNDHYTKRKLRGISHDLADKCYLPYVSYNNQELEEGLYLIEKYLNPIALVANSSLRWKHEREPKEPFFQNMVNQLNDLGHTVLQFGVSQNFTLLENTILILDLDIDTLIKYYAAIKKFIGVDTGDTHLMLAVGGVCDVYIPSRGSRLPHEWNYNHPNIQYHYFDK